MKLQENMSNGNNRPTSEFWTHCISSSLSEKRNQNGGDSKLRRIKELIISY